MSFAEQYDSGVGRGPAPMDESWWSAVLAEEQKHLAADFHKSDVYKGERSENRGSPEDWAWARELYDQDNTVHLLVIGYNRGGLLVEAHNLRGFVPVSHLVSFEPGIPEQDKAEKLASFVGEELCLKVIEYDPERGRLVFSQRAATAGPGRRAELLNTLEPNKCVNGIVTNITRFGVFVDLGGVEGLIHVSELSWGRVRHPADVVNCGDELQVQVLSVDQEQGRVALSLKELLPDPWEDVEDRFFIGQVVDGCITNVVKFGAFVGIEEGLEGLIHVSELGDGSFLHPRSVVSEGEHVRVRVIHIDAEERRLGLSLRQVPQSSEEEDVDADPEYHSEQPEALSF